MIAQNRIDRPGYLCRGAVPGAGGAGAKANLAVAVRVMTLLMVVTIFYLPVVLPLLLAGVEVDAGAIAQSLIVLMLIPLILGLLISHSPDTAKNWAPAMNKIGSLGILILLVVGLGLI